jgi:hypothetical protein
VISALRAIMAWRMRETSAPPTYYDPFISQLAVTRSHGLGPLLCCLTYSWYIFSLSLLVFFLSSSSLPLWLLHLTISSRPFALRARLLSSSCSYFTNRARFLSSCSACTRITRSRSSSSKKSSSSKAPFGLLPKTPDEDGPVVAGWKPQLALLPVAGWKPLKP